MTTENSYSDYIVYADESGDHGLSSINPDYPVFVLAFCIFNKKQYTKAVIPSVTQFKFQHFGHDMLILHEHDIRKEKNGFNLINRAGKTGFMTKLGSLIHQQPFVIVSAVIDKQLLADQYQYPDNPYHIALTFCLESLYGFLADKEQDTLETHVVVENRGKKEDSELETAFQQACDGHNALQHSLPFKVVFADKRTNSPGLQLADLIARPIGLHVLRPKQKNQAFDILKNKLYRPNASQIGSGQHRNYGLKRFP